MSRDLQRIFAREEVRQKMRGRIEKPSDVLAERLAGIFFGQVEHGKHEVQQTLISLVLEQQKEIEELKKKQ